MTNSRILEYILRLKDEASKDVEKFSGNIEKSGVTSQKAFKAMAVAGAAAATAIVAGLSLSIKRAAEFETTMSNIATLISGDSTEAIKTLHDEVLAMSKAMPKSVDELGGSLYDILSAGIQGTANQMMVLESSAKLATAGLGDTKGATDIMTSAINAFQLDAGKADKIADVLFKTVKNGKTTVDQMAQAFGATAPMVAAAGISLEEFSAATAALTTTGLPASQAQNALRASVTALTKPTSEMTELLKKAGFESGTTAMKTVGLVETMAKLKEAANGNQEMLAKAYGRVEGLGAAIALTDQVSGVFTSTLEDMKTGSDAVSEAFEKQKDTVASQMQILKNNVDALTISVGSMLLPKLNEFLTFVNTNLVAGIGNWEDMQQKVTSAIQYMVEIYNTHLKPSLDELWSTIQNELVPELKELWDMISPVLVPAIKILGQVVGTVLVFALKLAIETLTILVSWISTSISWFNKFVSTIRAIPGQIKGALEEAGNLLNKINPFHRESPSLVDNVLAGVKLIKREYEGLSGMELPSINQSLSPAFAGSGSITNNSSFQAPINVQATINNQMDAHELAHILGFELEMRSRF